MNPRNLPPWLARLPWPARLSALTRRPAAGLRRSPVPLSVRLRLTLLYGGLFLAAGILLLAVNYVLVERGLENRRLTVDVADAVRTPGHPADTHDAFTFRMPRFAVPGSPLAQRREAAEGQWQEIVEQLEALEQQVQDRALAELVTRSGYALVVMTVLAVGLGWLVAGRVLHPLKRITTTAKRLSGSNLHERINLRGPDDEMKELADTFDEMLNRLDASFASQRRFVANASHELRTPLAIARTEVDVALADPDTTAEQFRATAERVRDATQRSERLIASLLVLARSERRPDASDPVDLAAAAADALDAAGGEVRARGLRVEADLSEAVVAGDRPLLERLVANLVENAVRHNVEGGWIRVTTGTAGTMGRGCAGVAVANSGEALPADEIAGLFEPFRRRTRARTGADRGAGLGLSIVRAVADTHGGQVRARPLADGGLEVLAVLPALAVGPSGYAVPGATPASAP